MIKLNKCSFFRVVRQTLSMLFPFALLGSFSQMIYRAFLSQNGLFYNIAYLGDWVPDWLMRDLQAAFIGVSRITFNLFGILVVYAAAKYTARIYHRDSQLAGATGIIVLLLIAFRYDHAAFDHAIGFNWRLLSTQSMLIALIVGYAIGQVYRWLGVERNFQKTRQIISVRDRSFYAMKPLVTSIILAIIFTYILNFGLLSKVLRGVYSQMVTVGQNNQGIWLTIAGTALITLFDWLGLGSVANSGAVLSGGPFASNLSYALQHGSAWNIPHPFFGGSLYNSFANFGGNGLILALTVAIIITSRTKGQHQIARWTLVPTLFNSEYAAMVGFPIIMNPLYLLPIQLLPIMNIIIAAGAIALHIIPPTPYPVLMGTPGPLISFVASNGNWWVLVFTLALFVLDVWCFIPFVKIIDHFDQELSLDSSEVDYYAKK
ncbi:PTS transporter subunit EIIC [Limosilactobacillus sp.]|uniref:PTS transporter subunit EIIC n=2 Tax=Limosilactobacillus sp. TaxID=2773925 RepID=UPI0025BCFDE1|nr:PTS transporter subunit EIIC [Limosilactobacillus sp.]MCI2030903.1 PTS transporter subunit EIIC [Limosilactobacillus sp.]